MQAEEIDRVLANNPHIIRNFQRLMMQRGTVTFIRDLALAAIDDVHDESCPETRRIVQRALFRAGHTGKVLFATGDDIVVFTSGLDDEFEIRDEIQHMSAQMEAIMWSRIVAREAGATEDK